MTAPTTPDPACRNCDGNGCMDCRTRTMHDECVNDCPECCPTPTLTSEFRVEAEWFVEGQREAEMLAEALMLLGAEGSGSSPVTLGDISDVGMSDTNGQAEPPRPSYEAIESAITTACEVAGVTLTLTDVDTGNPRPDPTYRLARILEQAGLIDAGGVGEPVD